MTVSWKAQKDCKKLDGFFEDEDEEGTPSYPKKKVKQS